MMEEWDGSAGITGKVKGLLAKPVDMKQRIRNSIADVLKGKGLIDDDSVGQLVLHINNGGVTKICRNNWEVK